MKSLKEARSRSPGSIGEQAGARDLQVLLAGLRPGAGPDGGLVSADDAGEEDQRPDRLVRRRDRLRGAGQQRVHPPVAGAGAGHRFEDARAALHRNVVHDEQEHAPGLEVQAVGDRARRARGPRRGVSDMPAAAGAFHLVPVILGGLRPRLGQVGDLVRVPHAQVSPAGQVSPAIASARREHIDRLVRLIAPRQVSARRPALLTRPAAAAPPRLALRRLLSRQVISARRHR